VQRYCDIPLPRSRYVPGRGPHPRHRAEPHLPPLPEPEPGAAAFDARSWQPSIAYRYAIDLFNHDYFWEAHEALEGLLSETDRRSSTGRFLSSLVQLSAAMLKDSPSSHPGAQRLMERALRGLPHGAQVFMGVDVAALVRDVRAVASGERTDPPRIQLRFDAVADAGPQTR